MATLLNTTKVSDATLRTGAEVQWINPSFIAIGCGIIGVLMVAARLYQQQYAWSMGLDATSPEFQKYWLNLLFSQFAVEAVAAAGIWGYVWLSRPRDLSWVEAPEELRRLGVFVALIFLYVFAVFWTG